MKRACLSMAMCLSLAGQAHAQDDAFLPTSVLPGRSEVTGLALRQFTTVKYGKLAGQSLRFIRPNKGKHSTSLVVFTGGDELPGLGGDYSWGSVVMKLLDDGFLVAFVSGRATIDVDIRERSGDLAAGIARLFEESERFCLDGTFVIVGGGTNAAYAALVGADPSLLADAGVTFARLRAVALIDGAGFDGPAEVAARDRLHRRYLQRFFGETPASQERNSAVGHLASPNAPAFRFLTVDDHGPRHDRAVAFASRLQDSGARVGVDTMVKPGQQKTNKSGDIALSEPEERLLRFIEEGRP